MRTTLDLDEDVLEAIKELAHMRRQTAGKVASDLVRKALAPPADVPKIRNGVPLLPRRTDGRIITNAFVRRLQEDED